MSSAVAVLIGTDWNLKPDYLVDDFIEEIVLIGTDWNLKNYDVIFSVVIQCVLIETDWNLKWESCQPAHV